MEKIFIGQGREKVYLLSNMLNRHGIISGATGTGKTVTLKVLAEKFTDLGIPVFLPDVKGDLMSFCEAGSMNSFIENRMKFFGMTDFAFKPFSIRLWDFFSNQGIPLRITISEMGPLLLSKLLNLNAIQSGILNIAFKLADDNGWLLLDLKDLKSILAYLAENAKDLKLQYGNISPSSVAAIQRSLMSLEAEGAELFFAEPSLDIQDFLVSEPNGQPAINVLNAKQLYQRPSLYSAFLLWFLSEVYESFPEVGDLDKPKLVMFFDEAHLMFDNCPKVLIDKIEQIIRLIRSKGVSIFFVTQNPSDIPETILSQLGNRIQHALRSYTAKDQRSIKQVAMTFRTNSELDIAEEITKLKTGEALVSVLQEDGSPSVSDKVSIAFPASKLGTLSETSINNIVNASPFFYKYKTLVDRESAYEILSRRLQEINQQKAFEEQEKALAKREAELAKQIRKRPKGMLEQMGGQVMTGFSRSIGHQLARGLMGSIKKLFN